jgi:hypothetical protein
MELNLASLSKHERTLFLARLASELTVCARTTYEVGAEGVLQPGALRAYNELLHRATGALRDHLTGSEGYSLEVILKMIREFAARNRRTGEVELALEQATKGVPKGA